MVLRRHEFCQTQALLSPLALVISRRRKTLSQGLRNVEALRLELADPSSVAQFAAEVLASNKTLDVLINDAGIMATPLMRDSRGYEMQFCDQSFGTFSTYSPLVGGA